MEWIFFITLMNRMLFCMLRAELREVNGSAFLTRGFCGVNAEVTLDGVVDGGQGE